jgi:hypothetical protein
MFLARAEFEEAAQGDRIYGGHTTAQGGAIYGEHSTARTPLTTNPPHIFPKSASSPADSLGRAAGPRFAVHRV